MANSSGMSIDSKLSAWEAEVQSVSEQQQGFKPVEPLIASLDSLLHYETVSQTLRKKALELVAKAESARQAVTAVKVRVVEALGNADAKIVAGVQKRERDVKTMEGKTGVVEGTLDQLKTETPAAAKGLEESSIKEVKELAANFEALYEREKGKSKEFVETTRDSVKATIVDTRTIATATLEDCKAFEEANSGKLAELEKSSGEGTMPLEEAKTTFVDGITAKLTEMMQELRQEFDQKLDAWPEKIAAQLLEIILEADKVYEAATGAPVKETESPDEQLKEWNKKVRRVLTHAGGYTMTSLRTLETTNFQPIRILLDKIKVLNLTDEGLKLLQEVSEKFPPCTALLTQIDTSLQSDLAHLAESLTLATDLAGKVANKTNDAVVLHVRLTKEVSAYTV